MRRSSPHGGAFHVSRPVVVGYDGGKAAEHVLGRAIDEARAAKSELVVVAVEEMPLDPDGLQNFGTLDDSPAPAMPAVAPPELVPVLDAARRQTELAGARAEFVWAVGEPAHQILEVARACNASLVVVGHHHHGLFTRLLGEDVARDVQRAAQCEVVLVDPE
jgi:nucleotide-binding universal stress UspA family protein